MSPQSLRDRIRLPGRVVLVTGGTRGIGLATGLAFGRAGADVYLTHRWGSADEGEILRRFAAAGAALPRIVEADASQRADTQEIMERIRREHGRLDVLVGNVCVVPLGAGLDSYKERDLLRALDYSSWPIVDYLQTAERVLGAYPRYALALSSDGPDRHYPGYDYVAVAKSVLETLCRYLANHLRGEGVRVNVLRTRQVVTRGYREIFGDEGAALARQFAEYEVSAGAVAETALALCSGLLDACSGQVITADRGAGFVDNVMTLGPRILRAAKEACDAAQ